MSDLLSLGCLVTIQVMVHITVAIQATLLCPPASSLGLSVLLFFFLFLATSITWRHNVSPSGLIQQPRCLCCCAIISSLSVLKWNILIFGSTQTKRTKLKLHLQARLRSKLQLSAFCQIFNNEALFGLSTQRFTVTGKYWTRCLEAMKQSFIKF